MRVTVDQGADEHDTCATNYVRVELPFADGRLRVVTITHEGVSQEIRDAYGDVLCDMAETHEDMLPSED